MTTIFPAPAYALARAAWIPTLVIWHADGRFTRLEGARCSTLITPPAAMMCHGRNRFTVAGGTESLAGFARRRRERRRVALARGHAAAGEVVAVMDLGVFDQGRPTRPCRMCGRVIPIKRVHPATARAERWHAWGLATWVEWCGHRQEILVPVLGVV